MEEQLLPREELRPAYGQAAWLYVYRDFSGSDADRAAEDVALRLGMTSYPQHFLLDPSTLEEIADTTRAIPTFLAAFAGAKVEKARSPAAADRVARADALAERIRTSGDAAAARKGLEDPDPLVRCRAAEVLLAKDPAALSARAADLLAVRNDPFRYLLCQSLAKAPRPAAAKALEGLLREPEGSRNPNVLRMRAAEALGACGNAGSVEALAPHAAAGWRNGLTRTVVKALRAVAERDRAAVPGARDALAAAYPEPEPGDAAAARAVTALAKEIHEALGAITGREVPFPGEYDAAARERLAKAWR